MFPLGNFNLHPEKSYQNYKTALGSSSSSKADKKVGPSVEEVGERLLFNLFPEPTARTAHAFAKAIAPAEGVGSLYTTCGSKLHELKVGVHAAELGGWWQSLIDAGKTVAESAGRALLDQAVAYIKKKSTMSAEHGTPKQSDLSDDVGKFAASLQLSLPILTQLSAAAVPKISPDEKVAGKDAPTDPFKASHKNIIGATVLKQITQTVGRNFIQSAQSVMNNSSAEELLQHIHNVVSSAAIGTIPTLINTVANRVLLAPESVQSSRVTPNSTTTAALAAHATDSTTQQALHDSYTSYGKEVATRGAQALIASANQLHQKHSSEHNSSTVTKDWWDAFYDSANQAASVIGFFSPSLQSNTNTSLANASEVQSTALTSGIQAATSAAASVVSVHYVRLSSQANDNPEAMGSFWNILSEMASTVGTVVSNVAPVAAKLLPLVL